jgi:hypothetical protein
VKRSRWERSTIYTLLLIIITLLSRLVIISFTGLGVGESSYFRSAKYLQLSYLEHPPLFFWIGGLAIRLLGENTFALRLPTVLMFAGTSWFLYQIGKRLFSVWAGFFAVLLVNISFVFTVSVACWFQPDAPLMFFWTACIYCIIQTIHPLEDYHTAIVLRKNYKTYFGWILVGITLGFASLSKYHIIFLIIGVFVFFLSHKEQRHWIWHPGPYIALLISFIFSLPVFIWNSQNDWISFVNRVSRAGSAGAFTLHFDWFFSDIAGQAVWLLPWIWVPLVWQIPKLPRAGKASSFCFWTAIFPILFFTLVALWRNPQGHFHWPAPGYMMLFIPLGSSVEKRFFSAEEDYSTTIFWLVTSAILTVFIVALLTVHMTTGIWTYYGPKWGAHKFANKPDPTMDGVDYDDVRIRFEKEGWLRKNNLFVGATRWWLAGKVDWALRAKKDFIVFNSDPLNYAFFSNPEKLKDYDAIVISRNHERTIKEVVEKFFNKVERLKDIEIVRAGVSEISLQVYYCTAFRLPVQSMEHIPLYRQLSGRKPFGE